MIEIKGVTKKYGEQLVLDNVSADIPRGSVTAFIGQNGCGKSTLLGIISRILPHDSGEVWIDGKNIAAWPSAELAKKIAVLKQQNNIQVRLTVEELVAFGRYPHSRGRLTRADRIHIDEAIRYMGLAALRHKSLDNLSGGEKQRAFIAMVIAQDTDYIFLDEPLNNLDMKHSVEIMQMLRKLCREKGKTVVIVLHDINFASCYCAYILAIRSRRIHINAGTEDVIQPEILRQIYDMDIDVCQVGGERICVYYNAG